eukprot:9167130-Alexandrium_andersonii.AAC.1
MCGSSRRLRRGSSTWPLSRKAMPGGSSCRQRLTPASSSTRTRNHKKCVRSREHVLCVVVPFLQFPAPRTPLLEAFVQTGP